MGVVRPRGIELVAGRDPEPFVCLGRLLFLQCTSEQVACLAPETTSERLATLVEPRCLDRPIRVLQDSAVRLGRGQRGTRLPSGPQPCQRSGSIQAVIRPWSRLPNGMVV